MNHQPRDRCSIWYLATPMTWTAFALVVIPAAIVVLASWVG